MKANVLLLPRLIRFRNAPAYLGMDRNRFNHEVRPYLVEIPVGRQGIAFDRLHLDAWADDYKAVRGRPPGKEASCFYKSLTRLQRSDNRRIDTYSGEGAGKNSHCKNR